MDLGQAARFGQVIVGGIGGGHAQVVGDRGVEEVCLLYTSPSPRDRTRSRMPSSA